MFHKSIQSVVFGFALFTVLLCVVATHPTAPNNNHNGAHGQRGVGDKLSGLLRGVIKHIVLLMEENRSFDHIFGFRPGVNGLNGTEWNWKNLSNTRAGKISAGGAATTINSCDPDHALPATTFKIFGTLDVTNESVPRMDGFVDWEARLGNSRSGYCDVMTTLNRTQLPVINTLADEFVLFDNFYASVPGPTWPNRLFFLCGTSGGQTETTNPWWMQQTGALVPLPTIMTQVQEAGLDWKAYVNDTPWELFVETLADNPDKIFLTEQFFEDARTGNLPALSVLNPRAGMNFTSRQMANDMHPDHDTSLAEAYYKDIYEALRASPAWNQTVFILTFDEHGGFYDHVPTVNNVPAPDHYPSYPDSFDFTRLGIRIPTLVISPWVAKGKVESSPPERAKPFPNSQYELTSVMATVRKLLNMSTTAPLTKRDAWAATFDHLFDELDTPRGDCPMHLPDPAPSTLPPDAEARLPLNSLQKHILEVHAHISGEAAALDEAVLPKTQAAVSEFLQSLFATHRDNTARMKEALASVTAAPPVVRCEPFYGMTPNYLTNSWKVVGNLSDKVFSFSPQLPGGVDFCLDASPLGSVALVGVDDSTGGVVSYPVGLTPCNNSRNGLLPSRISLRWIVTDDQSLRPLQNASLCLTTTCVTNSSQNYTRSAAFLSPCLSERGAAEQHWTLTPTVFEDNWSRTMQLLIGVWALVADNNNITVKSTSAGNSM